MSRGLLLSTLAVAVCWCPCAQAQDDAATPPPEHVLLEARPNGQIQSFDNAPSGGVPFTGIHAAASSDGGEIAFTLSNANSKKLLEDGQQSVALTLSSPIDDGASDASFITDEGLADTLHLNLAFSRVFLDLGGVRELEAMEQEYLRRCRDAAGRAFARQDETDRIADPVAFTRSFCGLGTSPRRLPADQLERGGLTPDEASFVRNHPGLRGEPLKVLNLSASIGRKEYDFLSPTDFSEEGSTKVPYAFSIAYGVNPSATGPFYGIGYEFAREYREGKKRTFCPPPSGTGPIECTTGVFGAPSGSTTHTVFALVRSTNLFGDPASGGLAPAVELKVAYDIENDVAGFSLPIYVLLDADGGPKGGFRLSVDREFSGDEEMDVQFGIFITQSFDFFKI